MRAPACKVTAAAADVAPATAAVGLVGWAGRVEAAVDAVAAVTAMAAAAAGGAMVAVESSAGEMGYPAVASAVLEGVGLEKVAAGTFLAVAVTAG